MDLHNVLCLATFAGSLIGFIERNSGKGALVA
jgi:hypothetical protein